MKFTIKSKKIISSVMALTMLTAATAAADTSFVKNIIPTNTITADAAVSGDWYYEAIDSVRCKVTGYKGSSTTVHIPESIANHTVVAIGRNTRNGQNIGAFENNNTLKNVYIPRGIGEIPADSFRNCCSLKTVVVPEALNRIGECAFENCTNLESVTGFTNIHYIDMGAFRNTGLKSFTNFANFATGDHFIGIQAFQYCHSLSTVKLYGDWSISREAFDGCTSLYNLEYSNMTTIDSAFGTGAFKGASNLTYLNGAQIFAYKAGQKYIFQKYRSVVGRYAWKLREDNVKLYMDYLNG